MSCLRRAAVATLAWMLVGCATAAPPTVDFSQAPKHYRAEDYPVVYEAWTRHDRVIGDIGTVMEVWATLKSWDFRQAYIAKFAKAYNLPDAERDTLAKAQQETARTVYEIHLQAQSTADKWNDLDRRNSAWRITLLDGTGAELSPASIKVEKFPEIYEMEFFPRRTLFTRAYTLRFVRPEAGQDPFVGPESGRLILRVASPAGKVEVSWAARESIH